SYSARTVSMNYVMIMHIKLHFIHTNLENNIKDVYDLLRQFFEL
ncbi:34789_t:CDS:1, partial [Racocetra persica]